MLEEIKQLLGSPCFMRVSTVTVDYVQLVLQAQEV